MKHTIFGLIALYITAAVLWVVKEVKEARNLGLLSGWSNIQKINKFTEKE